MDSFFFNITDTRYKVTQIFKNRQEYINRVDISNGVVYFEAKLLKNTQQIKLNNLDRMVMIVMVKKGFLHIYDAIGKTEKVVPAGKIGIYCSSRQNMTLTMHSDEYSEQFILFVSDFFLKRYLSMNKNEPIDFLYQKIQTEISLEEINMQSIDALSLYMLEKILGISYVHTMQSLRAEHKVIEFMIQRFSLLDIFSQSLSKEELALASRAKDALLQNFISPPTLAELAHICATNESKLKIVFKKVYKTTIHMYTQKLRLEEANLLMKEENLTIGEIASRVGYKHQGYFSKLFFSTYGVYPKELMKN